MRIRWTVPAVDLENIKTRPGQARTQLTPLPYLVVYSVKPSEAVEILHIHHGAQDWR